jgi:hypothetical protein
MTTIPDSARSEEHLFDPRFIKRWADRVVEIKHKYGQQVANDWFQKFFSAEAKREVNAELNKRFKNQNKGPNERA